VLEPPYNVRLDRPLVTSDSTSEFVISPDDDPLRGREKWGQTHMAPAVCWSSVLPHLLSLYPPPCCRCRH